MTVNGLINFDLSPSVVQTTDGTSTVTILTTPAFGNSDDGGQIVTFDVVGVDFPNDEVATAKVVVKLKNVSNTPTIVGTPVHLIPISVGSSSGLVTASVTVIISGTNLKVNVIGVTGRTIDWSCSRQPSFQVLNNLAAVTLSDGYISVYDDTNHRWKPVSVNAGVSGASILGDVTGTLAASTVVKAQGVAISASAPTSGQLLQLVGSTWTPTTIGGDVTGSPSASTVVKIQGRTVNSATPEDGYAMLWSQADGYWKIAPLTSGTFSPGGDLIGIDTSQKVIAATGQALSGYAGVTGTYGMLVNSPSNADHFTITPRKDSAVGYAQILQISGQKNSALNGGNVYVIGGESSAGGGGDVIITGGNGVSDFGFIRLASKGSGGTAGMGRIDIWGDELSLDVPTATSATAGSNGDVPAQVVGYIKFTLTPGGTVYKIPYYNT